MDKFYQADKTNVDYLHSIGAKYDFKNDLVLEAAFGQSGRRRSIFREGRYKFDLGGNPFTTSYQRPTARATK